MNTDNGCFIGCIGMIAATGVLLVGAVALVWLCLAAAGMGLDEDNGECSERDKPRGLTVVFPGTEQSFLAPLPIRAMSGIGASSEKRLADLGIKTLGQLARSDEAQLEKALGSAARTMRPICST